MNSIVPKDRFPSYRQILLSGFLYTNIQETIIMVKKIILGAVLLLSLGAEARPIDPMTQAVLNAYEEILRSDPGDYNTLYQRAMQYYQLSMYTQALADVDHALRLTPDTDKELKAREYELQGSLYAMQKQYPEAIASARKALALQPDNYELSYRLGEFCLLAGDIDGAKAAFQSMQRKQTRSPEAMLGLARVDLAQGKYENAMSKMKYAEEFNSSLWTTSQSIGDMLDALGQPQQAAMAYIKAIALADGQAMPLESLFSLASKNYPAVKAAIDEAIAKSPNSAAMPLLLGNVAFETGHYRDAGTALNNVLNHGQGRQPGVYSLLSECLLAQGRAAEAVDYASRAVELSPKANFLSVKARALRGKGDHAAALSVAQEAVKTQPASVEALVEEALAMIAMQKLNEAAAVLDKAVEMDPDDAYALVLAGTIHDMLQDGRAAGAYARASLSTGTTPALTAMKAIAQIRGGKSLDGDATLREMVKIPTSQSCYWAAVAYANTGDMSKADTLAAQARELGFENKYLLDMAKGPLTLRP